MSNQIHIGKQIKLIRTIQKIDLRTLAARTGISTAYLSFFENGQQVPTDKQLDDIEAALGVRFSQPEIQAAFDVLAQAALPGDGHQEQPND